MKPFTQVRLLSDPSRYGQIVAVADPRYPHSQHDVQVAWDGDDGKPTGHEWDEIRRETFLEFILNRPGYVGKTPLPFVLYCFLVWLGLLFSVPAFGAVLIALFFGFQYANFKGWTR
jgi:hypothetical protein